MADMQPEGCEIFDVVVLDWGRHAMRIRTQVTFDGVWTVFVDDDLCFSNLGSREAEALVAAFERLG